MNKKMFVRSFDVDVGVCNSMSLNFSFVFCFFVVVVVVSVRHIANNRVTTVRKATNNNTKIANWIMANSHVKSNRNVRHHWICERMYQMKCGRTSRDEVLSLSPAASYSKGSTSRRSVCIFITFEALIISILKDINCLNTVNRIAWSVCKFVYFRFSTFCITLFLLVWSERISLIFHSLTHSFHACKRRHF